MVGKRLLIVDDAMIMRRRIADLAGQAGWLVAGEATDGEEAVRMYKETRPDLVTLDIVMPNMDGVAALHEIREIDPAARVVMVTAVNQKDKLTECIGAGAMDFIVKPFDKATLLQFFEKVLAADTCD